MTMMSSQIHTLHVQCPNPSCLEGIICQSSNRIPEAGVTCFVFLFFPLHIYHFLSSILEGRSLTSQGRSPSLFWTFNPEEKLHWSQPPGEHICPQEEGSDLFTSFHWPILGTVPPSPPGPLTPVPFCLHLRRKQGCAIVPGKAEAGGY